jgi:hypothetical protein
MISSDANLPVQVSLASIIEEGTNADKRHKFTYQDHSDPVFATILGDPDGLPIICTRCRPHQRFRKKGRHVCNSNGHPGDQV